MRPEANFLKMTARDIRRNFLQYLSMIIITMLAVTLFCGFVSNTLTLKKKVDAYFDETNLTDLIAQFYKSGAVGSAQIGAEDKAYFSALKESGDIDSYEYRFYAEGAVERKTAKIYAARRGSPISKPHIAEGAAGTLVDVSMKNRDGYAIGRKVEIELPALSILPGFRESPMLEFEITGFMNFAEVSSTHLVTPVYIDIETLCAALKEKAGPLAPLISEDVLYNQALFKTGRPAEVKDIINARYSEMENNGGLVFVYSRDTIESVVALNGEVTTSLRMIYVFPVIFLLVSILVITTTSGALILRERTNIGTLKGIGFGNGRIMLHYSFFGVLLCLIGGIIGAAAGPFIVPNVMLIKYNLVYSLPSAGGIVFSPLWSAAAILTVCALAMLIGISACRSVYREKPAECMRPAPPKNNFLLRPAAKKNAAAAGKNATAVPNATASEKGGAGTGKDGNGERKGSLPLKMAVRNIAVKPSRALMTIAGVTGCVALLVCSFGIGDTVSNSIGLELERQFTCDILAVCSSSSSAEVIGFFDGLKEDGGIEDYETFKTFFMSARNGAAVKDINVYSLKEDSRFTTINPKSGVLLSKSVADELKIKKGGTLSLVSGANKYDVEIGGIVETAVTKGVFVSSGIFDESPHTVGIWIKAEESARLIDTVKAQKGVQEARGMQEIRGNVNRQVSSIDTIKFTLMIFSIALASSCFTTFPCSTSRKGTGISLR